MEGFPNYYYPQTWQTSRRSYILQTHQPAPNPLEAIRENLPDYTSIIPPHPTGHTGSPVLFQTETCHYWTNPPGHYVITEALESHKYCTAAFLNISQAFDKMWHEGPICKLRPLLAASNHKLLRSYLEHWYFLIKYKEAYTPLHPVLSGVPQGSVLGPLLYLLYTADLPTTAVSTTATFADDTVVLTAHENPTIASHRLQLHLREIQLRLKKMAYESKWNQIGPSHLHFKKGLVPLPLTPSN